MISGSSDRQLIDMGEGDYEGLDQYNFAKPFCKAAYRIDKPEDIALGVARAIRAALSGRPGGVYLDVPGELLGATMDLDAAKATIYAVNEPAPAMVPSQTSVDAALKLLAEAKNPLIYLGKGAAYAQCDQEESRTSCTRRASPTWPCRWPRASSPTPTPRTPPRPAASPCARPTW